MPIIPESWGKYPPEYNREIHGPYNPSVYYGKRDTPFGDVKLGELMNWFGRRRKSPRAIAQAISRAWFRYQLNWVAPKTPRYYYVSHIFLTTMFLNAIICYPAIFSKEKRYRYH